MLTILIHFFLIQLLPDGVTENRYHGEFGYVISKKDQMVLGDIAQPITMALHLQIGIQMNLVGFIK